MWRENVADFNLAIPITLENEGGYVWDKNDPGGETKYGISKHSYPNVDIKNLTVEQAKEIYLRDFWKFGGIINQGVANKLFDSYVNMGHLGILYAQELVFQVIKPDGVYGPETEDAINRAEPSVFLPAYRARLAKHYEDLVAAKPEEVEFLEGWLRRAKQ